jgi:hypothetical protein
VIGYKGSNGYKTSKNVLHNLWTDFSRLRFKLCCSGLVCRDQSLTCALKNKFKIELQDQSLNSGYQPRTFRIRVIMSREIFLITLYKYTNHSIPGIKTLSIWCLTHYAHLGKLPRFWKISHLNKIH